MGEPRGGGPPALCGAGGIICGHSERQWYEARHRQMPRWAPMEALLQSEASLRARLREEAASHRVRAPSHCAPTPDDRFADRCLRKEGYAGHVHTGRLSNIRSTADMLRSSEVLQSIHSPSPELRKAVGTDVAGQSSRRLGSPSRAVAAPPHHQTCSKHCLSDATIFINVALPTVLIVLANAFASSNRLVSASAPCFGDF